MERKLNKKLQMHEYTWQELIVMGELWEYIIDNCSLYFVSRRDLHFGGRDKSVGDQIRVWPRQYII